MLIDWFTVGAQALNFVILVALMQRFLYRPILHAIDAREERVAAEIAAADQKSREATRDRNELEREKTELETRRAALMSRARSEAEAERRRLLDEVRLEADALRRQRQEALHDDARELTRALGRRTHEEVFALVRKVLGDLASSSLEERMVDVLTRRLREIDEAAKARLVAALGAATTATSGTPTEPALVRSAFDLSAAQQASIREALDAMLGTRVVPRFEIAPQLVAGIEMSIHGQKVAWSLVDYATSLEKGVAHMLDELPEVESRS